MQAPVASQVLHWPCLPDPQQRVWQSALAHWESAEHVVPAGALQSPLETVYPLEQAVQDPDESQAEQKGEVPDLQQRVWQSPSAHWELAEHVVPAGARQFPDEGL